MGRNHIALHPGWSLRYLARLVRLPLSKICSRSRALIAPWRAVVRWRIAPSRRIRHHSRSSCAGRHEFGWTGSESLFLFTFSSHLLGDRSLHAYRFQPSIPRLSCRFHASHGNHPALPSLLRLSPLRGVVLRSPLLAPISPLALLVSLLCSPLVYRSKHLLCLTPQWRRTFSYYHVTAPSPTIPPLRSSSLSVSPIPAQYILSRKKPTHCDTLQYTTLFFRSFPPPSFLPSLPFLCVCVCVKIVVYHQRTSARAEREKFENLSHDSTVIRVAFILLSRP